MHAKLGTSPKRRQGHLHRAVDNNDVLEDALQNQLLIRRKEERSPVVWKRYSLFYIFTRGQKHEIGPENFSIFAPQQRFPTNYYSTNFVAVRLSREQKTVLQSFAASSAPE